MFDSKSNETFIICGCIQVHIYNWLIRNRSFSRSAIAKVQFLYLYYASSDNKNQSDLRIFYSRSSMMSHHRLPSSQWRVVCWCFGLVFCSIKEVLTRPPLSRLLTILHWLIALILQNSSCSVCSCLC